MHLENDWVRFACALSPVLVGFVLEGATSWVVIPGIVSILLASHSPHAGLALGIILEMIVARDHGGTAFLMLGGLWLAWLERISLHGLAALMFAGVGLLSTQIAWAGWGMAAMMLLIALFEWRKRKRGGGAIDD